MEGKIIKILLGAILVLVVLNYFESCNSRKETNRQLKKEIDSLQYKMNRIEKLSEERRDTVKNINNYQKTIIKESEGKKNEVLNTNNVDSAVVNYFRYRPSNPARQQ